MVAFVVGAGQNEVAPLSLPNLTILYAKWQLFSGNHLHYCFLFLETNLKMVTLNFFSVAMPSSWISFQYFVLGKTSVSWTQKCSKCSWVAFLGQSLLKQNSFHHSRDTEWTQVQWSDHFSYSSLSIPGDLFLRV